MSFERGIERVGVVMGVVVGVLSTYWTTYTCLEIGGIFAKETGHSDSLSVPLFVGFLLVSAIGTMFFYITKLGAWAVNWIIKGFKE